MSHGTLSWLLSILAWTAALVGVSYTNVYTSSKKIEDMVLLEEQILNNLQTAVSDLGNETASSFFSAFYRDRMQKVKERANDAGLLGYLKHPNGVYHSIKQFATEYQSIRSVLESTPSTSVQAYLSSIADQEDIAGARLSFIRLQSIYSLNASDMVKGNYLGYAGPELSDTDALEIGQAAFNEGRLDEAITWLQEALAKTSQKEPSAGFGFTEEPISLTGRILALLGRAYIRQGNDGMANEMYSKAKSEDPTDDQVIELGHELLSKPSFDVPETDNENFKRLCTLQNKMTVSTFDPRIKCSYREVILPYYRFKQELVSISPYVSLFYDVISDFEGETIISHVRRKLERGKVEWYGAKIRSEFRTSDLSWLLDSESPVAAHISKRIAGITNLVVEPDKPDGFFSSEAYQVVNYGMGGHYNMHYDALDKDSDKKYMQNGGNRMATFLIYLTDVERGGSTVFPTADIAVSPVKNMALFWYGYTPSGKSDVNTIHAGCPVVIGQKWVTNKWIWLYGNTFSRRCGLTEDATQLDIDQYMRKGWA